MILQLSNSCASDSLAGSLFARGDVLNDGYKPIRLSGFFSNEGSGQSGPDQTAVFANVSLLQDVSPDFPAQQAVYLFGIGIQIVRVGDVPVGKFQQLRRRISDNVAEFRIDPQEPALG